MATKKSPLARQKDEHESKEKLVDRVISVFGGIGPAASDADGFKARLLAASNKKLLRMHDVGSAVKSKYGSVDKLAEAVAETLGRSKDAPYVTKLKSYTPARLFDLLRAAEKQAKRVA